MTDVNRYSDGQLSSTELMQRAMEEAHAVEQGEGKKVAWHAGHESMDHAKSRMHDEPANVVGKVADAAAGYSAYEVIKDEVKSIAKEAFPGLGIEKGPGFLDKLKVAAGVAAMPEVAGPGLFALAVAEVVHACNQGDELQARSNADALDVAVTNLVDVDPGFKQAERAKFPGINAQATQLVFKGWDGKLTEFGKAHLPELQAACDAGSRAAFEAMRCGGREAFARLHPDTAKRLESDVAFNKGFESVMWCAAQPDRDARLNAIQSGLDARDVRGAHTQPVRG